MLQRTWNRIKGEPMSETQQVRTFYIAGGTLLGVGAGLTADYFSQAVGLLKGMTSLPLDWASAWTGMVFGLLIVGVGVYLLRLGRRKDNPKPVGYGKPALPEPEAESVDC